MNKKLYAQLYDYWHAYDDLDDYEFYRNHALQADGPILELGCGTGRILLPLLKEGLAVEGIDQCKEMLAACTAKAKKYNVVPVLHNHAIETMQLNTTYGLIFSALETFQHIADYRDAQKALNNIYNHLKDDGTFVVYVSLPWMYPVENAHEWRLIAKTIQPDGTKYSLHEKSIHDPLAQLYHNYYIIKKNDLEQEQFAITLRWYAPHEFNHLLAKAGFKSIHMQAGYFGDGPYDAILFTATK